MPRDFARRGDPARVLPLLWGERESGSRGPKPGLTVDRIVAAAIAISDAEGLDGLTMRAVAERLGRRRDVAVPLRPGQGRVARPHGRQSQRRDRSASFGAGGWRARLEGIARENLRLFERHPWLLQVSVARPPLGPGIIGKYDFELGALVDLGLTDVEMDTTLTLVLDFVRGSAASAVEASRAAGATGQSDDQWWLNVAPHLDKVFDARLFPLAARVGVAATDFYQGVGDPRHAFEFGLARLLDGIEIFIERTSDR